MRILSRYALKEFLKPFALVILAFMCIITVSELFDRMDTLVRCKPPLLTAMSYFFWRMPEWLVLIMPFSVLLATLFCLGNLARNNEILAMTSSGISLRQIVFSLLAFALVIVALVLVFGEVVVPCANKKADYTYTVNIRHEKIRRAHNRYNLILTGEQRRKYAIKSVDSDARVMKNVTIDEFSPDSVLSREIYAEKAEYSDTNRMRYRKQYRWTLHNGIVRKFDGTGKRISETKRFKTMTVYLPETMDDFYHGNVNINDMGFFHLARHIEKLRRNGIPTNRERVALHSRISYPFSCFIVMLLGIPFSVRSSRNPKMVGFALSIFMMFVFWGVISAGQALGEEKIIPAFLGAWFANIIFGVMALGMIWRVR